MPTTFYTEDEVKIIKADTRSLVRLASARLRYISHRSYVYQDKNPNKNWLYENGDFKDRYTGYDGGKDSSYRFIANQSLLDFYIALSQILTGMNMYNVKFLDAGCGIGNILEAAALCGIPGHHITGYDLDQDALNEGKRYFKANNHCIDGADSINLIKQDILTADYSKFDIIYYYHPFSDRDLERKFEEHIEDTIWIGAYIMLPRMKSSKRIDEDERFKKIDIIANNFSTNNIVVYKRVSVAKDKKSKEKQTNKRRKEKS